MNGVSSAHSRGKFSFGKFQNTRFQQDLDLARDGKQGCKMIEEGKAERTGKMPKGEAGGFPRIY